MVMQGYGATECGMASVTTRKDHGLGTVGRTIPPIEVRLAEDGEIQVSGPTLFSGYWRDPQTTAAAFTADGWYRTGDIGRHDAGGHLILMGRTKDIIVLPNGLNVYPEDIENALRVAGIRDSVVVETAAGPDRGGRPRPRLACPAPGRRHPGPQRERPAGRRCRSGRRSGPRSRRSFAAANATLASHQRVDRLAVVARSRLPADPHPQGEARPGARLGRRRRATPGPPGLIFRRRPAGIADSERLERRRRCRASAGSVDTDGDQV